MGYRPRARTYRHTCNPVPVDLLITGEVIGFICRWCYEDCTEDGRRFAPPLTTVKRGT